MKLIVILFIICCWCRVVHFHPHSSQVSLSSETFSKNRLQIYETLNEATELIVTGYRLPLRNYKEMFLQPMPHLQSLAFSTAEEVHHPMHPELLQTIFRQPYFKQLTHLNLRKLGLDRRHLQFLNELNCTGLALRELILAQNYFDKEAFALLSRLKFKDGLNYLDLNHNLLAKNEVIPLLLRLLCKDTASPCESNIQTLLLKQTAVNPEGLTQLLRGISTPQLETIDISYNLFKSQQLPKGTELLIFLSQLHFPSLQTLYLDGTFLSSTEVACLANWKLPRLELLSLSANFIDDSLSLWVNKHNLPLLKSLAIKGNPLTNQFLSHLRTQEYAFTTLQLGTNHIICNNTLDIQTTNLQALTIINSGLIQFTLDFLLIESRNQKLQHLIVHQTYLSDYQPDILHFLAFKNLKVAALPFVFSSTSEETFKANPNLKSLSLTAQAPFPQIQFAKSFPNLIFFSFSSSILTNLSSINPDYFPQNCEIRVNQITLKTSRSRLVLKELDRMETIVVSSVDSTYRKYFQSSADELKMPYAVGERVAGYFLSVLNITQLTSVNAANCASMDVLNILLNTANELLFATGIKLQFESSCSQTTISQIIKKLREISIPLLTEVSLKFAKQPDTKTVSNLEYFLRKNVHLRSLSLILPKESSDIILLLVNNQRFPYLEKIFISSLRADDNFFRTFLSRHSLTLRSIQLFGVAIPSLLFVSIVENDLVLTSLGIHSTSLFARLIAQFMQINTEFMEELSLTENRIDLSESQNIFSNSKFGFAKLKRLNFEGNDIRNSSLKALLERGVPNLAVVRLRSDNNPELLNEILAYSNRITQIWIENRYLGVLKQTSPAVSRSISDVQIDIKGFIQSDFLKLGSLDWNHLRLFNVILHNIYDCNTLQSIITIIRKASFVYLGLSNPSRTAILNSSCLSKHFLQGMSPLQTLEITDEYGTSLIPHFLFQIISHNQPLTTLILKRFKLGNKAALDLFGRLNLSFMRNLRLEQTYLTDESISKLSAQLLPKIRMLSLQNNYFSTVGLLGLMKVFPQLQQLDLSQNYLSDEFLRELSGNEYPQLRRLNVRDIGVTFLGLSYLADLRAPNLASLDISANEMSETDLVDIFELYSTRQFPSMKQLNVTQQLSQSNFDRITESPLSQRVRIRGLTLHQHNHQEL